MHLAHLKEKGIDYIRIRATRASHQHFKTENALTDIVLLLVTLNSILKRIIFFVIKLQRVMLM